MCGNDMVCLCDQGSRTQRELSELGSISIDRHGYILILEEQNLMYYAIWGSFASANESKSYRLQVKTNPAVVFCDIDASA